jgi:acetyltransferase-like isoleucine patch superfamily enzyme
LSDVLVRSYRHKRLRPLILKVARRLEGGEYTSVTLRAIFAKYWGVEIGMYSHGGCFRPWAVGPHTKIGRYCSFAQGARVVQNHPLSLKSTHALFFNPLLGIVDDDRLGSPINPLEIGNDVWLGEYSVILPEVNRIGNGAVIGAGAVVSRDVPDYAVVLGNPARLVKYRFSEQTIQRLLDEKWWEKDIDELSANLADFQQTLS